MPCLRPLCPGLALLGLPGAIDDIFMAFLKWNPFSWVPHSPLHLFGRPLISVEPFQRDLPTKFRAEARPSERKLIVLWSIDTWRLTIELPDHKSTAWNTSILLLLRQKLVGQLNHVGLIIPKACPFLSRLYLAQELAGRKGAGACLECGYRPTPLAPFSPASIWSHSVSPPSSSDQPASGIGDFNLNTGRAWRWKIPADLRIRASLSSLSSLPFIRPKPAYRRSSESSARRTARPLQAGFTNPDFMMLSHFSSISPGPPPSSSCGSSVCSVQPVDPRRRELRGGLSLVRPPVSPFNRRIQLLSRRDCFSSKTNFNTIFTVNLTRG